MNLQTEIPAWYVVAGGPSSGKTTLIKGIEKLGYYTVQEAAKFVIDENIAKGISVEDLRKDGGRFAQIVFQKNLQLEAAAPRDRIVFFDRGIPDCIVYHKLAGLDTKHIDTISRGRYRKVFFLDPLPFYENDYTRPEDSDLAARLSNLLLNVYNDLDYTIVKVPPVSVEERVKLVISSL